MNPLFELPNSKGHPIIGAALSVLLVFLAGCAARMAQQEIDTLKEQHIAVGQAWDLWRLEEIERNSKCRGAQDTFVKLSAQTQEPQVQPFFDYLRHAYVVQKYMDEKRVTAETALTVMGDLVSPPRPPKELDPFPGCMFVLGDPPERTVTYQQGQKFLDDLVFYWKSSDWRESEQARLTIRDKFLPPEKRTPFVRFLDEYISALTHMLNERAEKGEITLLQRINVINAAAEYLGQQMSLHDAQLKENLNRAKARDDALLATIAVGLGAVATTAALAVNTYENYRIANAQTAMARAMQLHALQAQAPIVCNYTLPARYGTQGYIYCR